MEKIRIYTLHGLLYSMKPRCQLLVSFRIFQKSHFCFWKTLSESVEVEKSRRELIFLSHWKRKVAVFAQNRALMYRLNCIDIACISVSFNTLKIVMCKDWNTEANDQYVMRPGLMGHFPFPAATHVQKNDEHKGFSASVVAYYLNLNP